MSWKEFKKNINTREKYLEFVKKNLKMAPIPDEYKGEVDAAIDSIDKETYEKEFERIGNNYSKIVIGEASRNSANRKGKTRGGRKKKRRKTKKIQKGGVGIDVMVCYITLGGIALCFISNYIIECGCSRPCGIPPGKEASSVRYQRRVENSRRRRGHARKGRHINEKIEENRKIKNIISGRRGKSPLRVKPAPTIYDDFYDEGSLDDPNMDIEITYRNQKQNPTAEEEVEMGEAIHFAENLQEFGASGASHLEEMREKYPRMRGRNPKKRVTVLTEAENNNQKEEERRRRYYDSANFGTSSGGPWSGIFGSRRG